MLERQIAYALTCIRRLASGHLGVVEVTAEAQVASNARLQRRLASTVWATSCRSWYKTASGKITNNWSGPTIAYWWWTRSPRRGDFAPPPTPGGVSATAATSAHSGTAGSRE